MRRCVVLGQFLHDSESAHHTGASHLPGAGELTLWGASDWPKLGWRLSRYSINADRSPERGFPDSRQHGRAAFLGGRNGNVQERLWAYPQLRFVLVTQVVVGAVDTMRVGIVEEKPWLIPNPHYGRRER